MSPLDWLRLLLSDGRSRVVFGLLMLGCLAYGVVLGVGL